MGEQKMFESNIRPVEWTGSCVRLIDQTVLPYEYKHVDIKTWKEMASAIRTMIVRGAPAIGISGAFGVALAAAEYASCNDREDFLQRLEMAGAYLKSTRPTAVNLMWAVDKQVELANSLDSDPQTIKQKLEENAIAILEEDIAMNKKIGEYGANIVPKGGTILTHCNAGALATGGYGTALGVVRSAYAKDPSIKVFADETRPRQQGARLTAWELLEDNIPVTLITDGMCGYFMKKGMIDVVVTGADRVALNGDSANKIGTYTVAIAAKAHNIPFYIAVPYSSIDISLETGEDIPIEERDREEVTHINGKLVCPEGVNIINPAFDVTPAEYITGIITETGINKPSELKKGLFQSSAK